MPQHSVLRVFVQSQTHNFRAPVSSSNMIQSWGSGWVCDAAQLANCSIPFVRQEQQPFTAEELQEKLLSLGIKRSKQGQFPIIVTNAHVVEGMKECSIQLDGDSALTKCELFCTFPTRDLAILLPPDNLIDSLICSEVSMKVIEQGDPVDVHGYPKNGQGERSLTKGTLSRTIPGTYAHANLSTLEYEMTATINGGNSGGPVVIKNAEGRELVVAIAHQHQTNAANQFNSIPVFHLVAGFRDYLRHRKDFGLQTLPLKYDPLKNQEIRAFWGLDPKGSDGALVASTSALYDFYLPLKAGDIILEVDGYSVNSDGKIALFPQGVGRIPFENYLHFLPPYSTVNIKIKREGKDITTSCMLVASLHCLQREQRLPTQNPPIFARHGLVFCGEIGSTAIFKTYQTATGNTISTKLYARVSQNEFKSPTSMGTVVFFPFTNTMGVTLEEANVIAKVRIHGKYHNIRDIYHLFSILNNSKTAANQSSERIGEEKFVAFYGNVNDEVPFFVVKLLSEEEEIASRKRYGIDERFSPKHFAENYLPKTQSWELVRERFRQGFFKAPAPIVIENTPGEPTFTSGPAT